MDWKSIFFAIKKIKSKWQFKGETNASLLGILGNFIIKYQYPDAIIYSNRIKLKLSGTIAIQLNGVTNQSLSIQSAGFSIYKNDVLEEVITLAPIINDDETNWSLTKVISVNKNDVIYCVVEPSTQSSPATFNFGVTARADIVDNSLFELN